jgi:hypothetical protein
MHPPPAAHDGAPAFRILRPRVTKTVGSKFKMCRCRRGFVGSPAPIRLFVPEAAAAAAGIGQMRRRSGTALYAFDGPGQEGSRCGPPRVRSGPAHIHGSHGPWIVGRPIYMATWARKSKFSLRCRSSPPATIQLGADIALTAATCNNLEAIASFRISSSF